MKPPLWQTIFRSGRLKCPACGQGALAKNWRQTHEKCPQCGFDFRVEGGFYLGSIYLNYGAVALAMLSIGAPLVWFGWVSPWIACTVGFVLSILMSLWFWRYARSLWLGLGYYIDHNVRAPSKPAAADGESTERYQTHLNADEESLDCVCPFCHTRFPFAKSRRKTWAACAYCGEKILLEADENK